MDGLCCFPCLGYIPDTQCEGAQIGCTWVRRYQSQGLQPNAKYMKPSCMRGAWPLFPRRPESMNAAMRTHHEYQAQTEQLTVVTVLPILSSSVSFAYQFVALLSSRLLVSIILALGFRSLAVLPGAKGVVRSSSAIYPWQVLLGFHRASSASVYSPGKMCTSSTAAYCRYRRS